MSNARFASLCKRYESSLCFCFISTLRGYNFINYSPASYEACFFVLIRVLTMSFKNFSISTANKHARPSTSGRCPTAANRICHFLIFLIGVRFPRNLLGVCVCVFVWTFSRPFFVHERWNPQSCVQVQHSLSYDHYNYFDDYCQTFYFSL